MEGKARHLGGQNGQEGQTPRGRAWRPSSNLLPHPHSTHLSLLLLVTLELLQVPVAVLGLQPSKAQSR